MQVKMQLEGAMQPRRVLLSRQGRSEDQPFVSTNGISSRVQQLLNRTTDRRAQLIQQARSSVGWSPKLVAETLLQENYRNRPNYYGNSDEPINGSELFQDDRSMDMGELHDHLDMIELLELEQEIRKELAHIHLESEIHEAENYYTADDSIFYDDAEKDEVLCPVCSSSYLSSHEQIDTEMEVQSDPHLYCSECNLQLVGYTSTDLKAIIGDILDLHRRPCENLQCTIHETDGFPHGAFSYISYIRFSSYESFRLQAECEFCGFLRVI